MFSYISLFLTTITVFPLYVSIN